MKLNIKQKTILILSLYLIIPFILIISFISHNIKNIVNEKFQNELKEKKQFVINFIKFDNKNFQKVLHQLSYSKEIISVINKIIVYNNIKEVQDSLNNILKNLDVNFIVLYSSNKKELVKNKDFDIIFPLKVLQNKIQLFITEHNNNFYLVGTSPLYIGTIEKSIYGYIALIRILDKKYFKNLNYIFNIRNLSLSTELDEKRNFHLAIGETITGKTVFLNGDIDSSFYKRIKRENKILFFSLIILVLLFCMITSYLIINNIIKPLNFLESSLDSISIDNIFNKLPEYAKNNEISKIINKLSFFFKKLYKNFEEMQKKTNLQYEELSKIEEDINVINYNKDSIIDKCEDLDKTHEQIQYKINELESINNELLNKIDSSLSSFNNIIELSNEATTTSNISNITFKEINRNSEEIKNFLNFIMDISSQIDILSVNASIEAIKSGEVGSGFSVVADEIKSLAATTREFVENIQKLIQNNYNIVKQGGEYSEKVNNILTQLNEEINNSFKSLNLIKQQIKQQKETIILLEKYTNEPGELKKVIDSVINNIEIVLNDLNIKINNLKELNIGIQKHIEGYIFKNKKRESNEN